MTTDREPALLQRMREFTAAELLPNERYFDGRPDVPTPVSAKLHAAGLANWWLAPGYGGAGATLRDSVDIVSALSYGDAGFAFASFLSILGTTMLRLFGPPDLAEHHLAELGRRGGCCAILVSEEESGSELGRIATTFATKDDQIVLNGDKYFSTNTDGADFLMVVARSQSDDGVFSVVLVPRDTPGIEIVQRWDMIGLRGSGTYQVRLRDCAVPAGNALPGHGLRQPGGRPERQPDPHRRHRHRGCPPGARRRHGLCGRQARQGRSAGQQRGIRRQARPDRECPST